KSDQNKYQEQYDQWKDGSAIKIALHTIVGGAAASLGGGDIAAGSLAGMANEAVIPAMSKQIESQGIIRGTKEYASLMQMASTVVGAAVGMVVNSKAGAESGAAVALSSTTNNFLGHLQYQEMKRLRAKGKDRTQEESERLVILEAANQISDGLLEKTRNEIPLTEDERHNLQIFLGAYYMQEGEAATDRLLQSGISPTKDYSYPYGGTSAMKTAYTEKNLTSLDYIFGRTKTENEKQYLDARADANLYLNTTTNEDLLPTSLSRRSDARLLDSLLNSSLASGVYGGSRILSIGTEEQRRTGAALLSNLSDIGLSVMLYKAGLGPVFGSTPETLIKKSSDVKGLSNTFMSNAGLNPTSEKPVTDKALTIYKVWPENKGFFGGYSVAGEVRPGQVFSRVGDLDGIYVSPPGTSISARGLPSNYPNQTETLWKVVRPIKYEGGIAAPWKDASGMGIQYRLEDKIRNLWNAGKIQPIITNRGSNEN
ncbi:MAG: TNT domain-containing protein, partial [Nitrospirae bacterium]|nr:TNT domain-containing protein [Nitrospirota bacterium]